jgi:hypothetical protein
MKTLLTLLLCLFAPLAFAGDYLAPGAAGKHFDCSKGAIVAYENDQVIVLCQGLSLQKNSKAHKWEGSYADGTVLVKSAGPMDRAQVDQIAFDTFNAGFYDRSEKRRFRFLLAGTVLDVGSTGLGLIGGACHEANPLNHVPVLGIGIQVVNVVMTRRDMARSSRFFSTAGNFEGTMAVANGAIHGLAGLHNLLRC